MHLNLNAIKMIDIILKMPFKFSVSIVGGVLPTFEISEYVIKNTGILSFSNCSR